MGELIAWLEREERGGRLHRLLLTGMFVARLLAIYTFQDANGRLSRLLTTLLFLRFGYAYAPYSSLEWVLDKSGEDYPLALRLTQMTLGGDTPDWEPWLIYFLRALWQQKRRLAESWFSVLLHHQNELPFSIQSAILFKVRSAALTIHLPSMLPDSAVIARLDSKPRATH
jgi:Fic family protein